MLNPLRRNMKTIFWVLVVVTVFTFVGGTFLSQYLGRGGGVGGSGNEVASVNGQPVLRDELERVLREKGDQYKYQYGDYPDGDALRRLRREALTELIDRRLADKRADAEGVAVTADEIARQIRALPAFQTGGVFDPQKYQNFLANPSADWGGIEASMRLELSRQRLAAYLSDAAQVTDAEVAEAAAEESEELTIRYIRVSAEALAKPADVPAEEVRPTATSSAARAMPKRPLPRDKRPRCWPGSVAAPPLNRSRARAPTTCRTPRPAETSAIFQEARWCRTSRRPPFR